MRLAIAILTALTTATMVNAQSRGFTGPFTGYEAGVLSELWPQIRQAQDYEDINWRAHGVTREPGNADAQSLLAANWDELRREQRFEDIDWDDYYLGRSTRSRSVERYGRVDSGYPADSRGYDESPFTREEAAAMSRAWGHIREAARFEDIEWSAVGLARPPGDRDARRLMSRYWGQLREAGRFEEIDWQSTTGYRAR